MTRYHHLRMLAAILAGLFGGALSLQAAQLQITLPLGRVAYQTNEQIHIAVTRSDAQALPADTLALVMTGQDGSSVTATFPVNAVAVAGELARTTEHYHFNGRLLRPGQYTVNATVHGATASTAFGLYSHLRKSPFRLLEWGSRASKDEQALLGEDSLGFNTNYTMYGGIDKDAMIRGGVDYMPSCALGGGHQLGLRLECDWSDPYVLQGGVIATSAFHALQNRTAPNCLGIHFYDEPGLTWHMHERTGQMVPFNIPAQDRAYRSAFGEDAPFYADMKGHPELGEKWAELTRWKQAFMEATWKLAANSVSKVNPQFISATQSVYGFWANTDGYYFNITRSLPMINGHGGYSDWGPGYFHPSMTHEFGRMRDLDKPNWYLPAWNGGMPANQIRMEQYLSFMTNLQGMMIPPDQQVHKPYGLPAAEGIVESNKIMGRLGTIFTTMPVTRPDVAVLYSLSQIIDSQIRHLVNGDDPNSSLSGDGHSLEKQWPAYIAAKMAHYSAMPIVEEDILDGTLAVNHKALFIHSVAYLDPRVITALEGYIAAGGVVLLSDDCQVTIAGAQKLGVAIDVSLYQQINKAMAAKDEATVAKLNTVGQYMANAAPLAKALADKLSAAGIKPDLDVDNPAIIVSRQAQGDIEYFFAVNAAWDEQAGKLNSIKAASATVRLADDGRPVYDAVRGGSVSELTADRGKKQLAGVVKFGAGAMRVFARTARPIGGVHIATPTISKRFTAEELPIAVHLTATLVDNNGRLLNGAAPLSIRVLDPQRTARYDLYRATKNGVCELSLPLAANDPAGNWTVEVTELLSMTTQQTTFAYQPGAQCGAIAGAVARAVYFGNDREQIFQFFRTQNDVAIIKGSSDYCAPAAERLVEIFKPWGIRCTIIDAADANTARELPEAARATWASPYGGYRMDPNAKPTPGQVGYAVTQSAILLGTPDDNPIIKAIMMQPYNGTLLPYPPNKDTFPGAGRGYLAWQNHVLGFDGQESITCIAYDAQGMNEAIGTLYEAATGLTPLTPLTLPNSTAIVPANKGLAIPEAALAWQVVLPDRAAAITISANGQITVDTIDGTRSTLDATGKVLRQQAEKVESPLTVAAPQIPDAWKEKLAPDRLPKFLLAGNGITAVAYWGGTLQRFAADGTLLTQQVLPQDINALAWSGTTLVLGLSDGRVIALK